MRFGFSLYIILALLLLGSCAYSESLDEEVARAYPVLFGTEIGVATRGATHAEAAALLNNQFVLYGTKQTATSEMQLVLHNYSLHYVVNSAHTTTTNAADWEYVGYDNTYLSTQQSIKYWDFSSPVYHMQAYSLGKGATTGSTTTWAVPTEMTETGYQLKGSKAELSTCYITDRQNVRPAEAYASPVEMRFMNLAARIRIALYETVPGYAIMNVRFYRNDTQQNTPATDAVFYAQDNIFIDRATYSISYADATGRVAATPTFTTADAQPSFTFGALNYAPAASHLGAPDGVLGELSSAPTYAGKVSDPGYYSLILPYPGQTLPIHFKVDYTLRSIDGTQEDIYVTGATAVVPTVYCQWKANHSYTYLFKISDNTNGTTGGADDPAGLYPITFDACVEAAGSDNNEQGTITSFGQWSITTYQPESVIETGIRYVTHKQIDVSAVLTTEPAADKENLEGMQDWLVIYHQQTPYEWVVEYTEPTSVVVVDDAAYRVAPITYSDGFGHFIPQSPGTYRVEYWHRDGTATPIRRAVKIVLVEEGSPAADFTGENLPANSFDTE